MIYKTLIILLLITFSTRLYPQNSSKYDHALIDEINSKRKYIQKKTSTLIQKEVKESIFNDFAKKFEHNANAVTIHNLFRQIILIEEAPKITQGYCYSYWLPFKYVKDTTFISIFVTALNSLDKKIRTDALNILRENVSENNLGIYYERISAALKQFPEKENNADFLALLPLKTEDRDKFANDTLLPLPIRARCGDTVSENKCISDFVNSKNAEEQIKYCKVLSYIGTVKCSKTLLKALNSPYFTKLSESRVVSSRVFIIAALGRINPEEPLLIDTLCRIAYLSEEKYGGKSMVNSYIVSVKFSYFLNACLFGKN